MEIITPLERNMKTSDMRSSTPPEAPKEPLTKSPIVLPSCRELFKVSDRGKGVDLAIDFKLSVPHRSPTESPPTTSRVTLPSIRLNQPESADPPRLDRSSSSSFLGQKGQTIVPYVPLHLLTKSETILPNGYLPEKRSHTLLSLFEPRVAPASRATSGVRVQWQLPPPAPRRPLRRSPSTATHRPRPYPKLPLVYTSGPSSSFRNGSASSYSTPEPPSPPLTNTHVRPFSRPHPSQIAFSSRTPSHQSGKESTRKTNQCPYCPRFFTRHHDLSRHICTHTGERPWVCRFCEKGFVRRDVCRLHENRCKARQPYEVSRN